MNILFVGHYGFVNRGCEAIVRGTIRTLNESLPASTYTLISKHADLDRESIQASGLPITRVVAAETDYDRGSLKWLISVLRRKVLHPEMSYYDFNHRNLYSTHDLTISIGGDNFSDDYGSPALYFNTLREAKKRGSLTVIWGASVGPFHKSSEEAQWVKVLRNVDLITVREKPSEDYLYSLGLNQNVIRVGDPAFLMEPSKPKHLARGFDGAKLLGIGLSGLLAERYGDKYLLPMTELVKHIIARTDYRVILVPHVFGTARLTDDVWVCDAIGHRVAANGDRIVKLTSKLNASELKYCISLCDLFIGARTHSTIASFSSGVPTLTIAYSVKGWGISRELLGTDAFTLDINTLSPTQIVSAFSNLQLQSSEIRHRLLKSIPRLQSLAQLGGERLASLIKSKMIVNNNESLPQSLSKEETQLA